MKLNTFFIICISTFTFLFTSACEQTDLQVSKSANDGTQKIETRGNCDQCPGSGQCCCFVKLHPMQSSAILTICGSTSGLSTCTRPADGVCPAFNGISYSISLDLTTPGLPFCALVSGPFWIRNDSGFPVRLIISCQIDLTSPEETIINLDTGASIYFENNGDCEITPC